MLSENIKIAISSISENRLRSILTMLIIAIGITALVGILTAIDSIEKSISSNFTSLGANTFTIRNRELNVHIGRGNRKNRKFRNITYQEAVRFADVFTFPAKVAVSTIASQTAQLKWGKNKSNPNVLTMAGDLNYLDCGGYEIGLGRNFNSTEIQFREPVVIIGTEIRKRLFGNKVNPLNKMVSMGSMKFKVIGVLKEKGSSMSMGGDKVIIIPISTARQHFALDENSYVINVMARSPGEMNVAIGEATGLFRKVRKLTLSQPDNFEIIKSDSLANLLIENLSMVTLAATLIGFITLLGAAIGLMNIMLVSVTERTREIGIRKSMGATKRHIRIQFLIEAIVICQLGGLAGIVLGIGVGNLTSVMVGTGFLVPWKWIFGGISLCFAVGLIAGLYPAVKASSLDPVEALRYE